MYISHLPLIKRIQKKDYKASQNDNKDIVEATGRHLIWFSDAAVQVEGDTKQSPLIVQSAIAIILRKESSHVWKNTRDDHR